MKNILMILLIMTLLGCVTTSQDAAEDFNFPITIITQPDRVTNTLTTSQIQKLLRDVEFRVRLGDVNGIVKKSKEAYNIDFFSLESDDDKKAYVELLYYRLLAHKARIMWDKFKLKEGFLYLEEIALVFPYAEEFVNQLSPYIQSLVPPEEPFILQSSPDYIARDIEEIVPLPNGGFISVGNDKSVIIWSDKLTKVKEIFVPASRKMDGLLESIDIHPTKPYIVCAGVVSRSWDGLNMGYIINYETGEIVHKFTIFGSYSSEIKYSPDGRYIAAGEHSFHQFLIIDTKNWHRYHSEALGIDNSYGNGVNHIVTTNSGVIFQFDDGSIEKYSYSFELQKRVDYSIHNSEYSMDINRDRTMIAFQQSLGKILILDPETLEIIRTIDSGKKLYKIKWDNNNGLYATGNYYLTDSKEYLIYYWDRVDAAEFKKIAVGLSKIDEYSILSDNRVIYFNDFNEMGIIENGESKIVHSYNNTIFDRANGDRVALFSPVGTNFAFDDERGYLVSFDLLKREIKVNENYRGFYPTREDSGHTITVGKNPTVNGVELNNRNGYLFDTALSGSLLFKKDNVIWTNGHWIFMSDLDGKRIWQIDQLPDTCFAVFGSYDYRFVIALFVDGSVNWYDQQSGQLLFTLLLDPKSNRWLIYTPEGYYDTSDKEAALMASYHINNGSEHVATRASLDQFAEVYYRPDIIDDILSRKAGDKSEDLGRIKFKPPQISNFQVNGLSIEPGYFEIPISSERVTIDTTFEIVSNTPNISGVEIFSNGRPISFYKLKSSGNAVIETIGPQKYRVNLTLPLNELDNKFRIFFRNDFGVTSAERIVRCYYSDEKSAPEILLNKTKQKLNNKGNLHVLLVGVSEYKSALISDLRYPDEDVKSLEKLFDSQKDNYKNVYLHPLFEDKLGTEVSKEKILESLDQIERDLEDGDRILVYLSGHGDIIDGTYFFLTADSDPESKESLTGTTLTFSELGKRLKAMDLASDIFLMVDACYSGHITSRELGYVLKDSGLTLIMSSRGDQVSIESDRFDHGLFTYALLEAFGEIASDIESDFNGDGLISVGELIKFTSNRMNSITGGLQVPWVPEYSDYVGNKIIGYKN